MTPRELPKYEVLFFLFYFDLVGRVRALGERIRFN